MRGFAQAGDLAQAIDEAPDPASCTFWGVRAVLRSVGEVEINLPVVLWYLYFFFLILRVVDSHVFSDHRGGHSHSRGGSTAHHGGGMCHGEWLALKYGCGEVFGAGWGRVPSGIWVIGWG